MQLDLALFQTAPAPEPKIHTVTEVTRRLRELIEHGIGELWVEGEVSNLRRQSSGHQYFTLKDDSCQLNCVLFSGTAAILHRIQLADGQRVQVLGLISVYEPRGQYQMIARIVQARGAGTLQAKFEALKRKLAAEGLFEPARKRPLPRFPRRIGLVTSPTGAAVRDFLKVLHRRQPGIEVLINPVRVQGRGASLEIARAIREFGDRSRGRLPAVDVIVITRGGGSIEDLWEFNEEIVARAIAASPVPVLSAIGHEIDFTIADFVADLRAPTPSAAAEILAADRLEVLARLRQHFTRLRSACTGRLELLRARLDASRRSALFREPSRRLLELLQTLDRRSDAMNRSIALRLEREQNRFDRLATRLLAKAPAKAIGDRRLRCQLLAERVHEAMRREITARKARLDRAIGVLHALNPQAILTRGYTITMDSSGLPYTSSHAIAEGTLLRTRFHDGEVESITAKR
jgi:exodeoxyribonuclease VII large subunit